MAYRVDPRGSFGRERFVAAVSADDFAQARALFDAVPTPPHGVADWMTRAIEDRVSAALGAGLAITARPTKGEALAVWIGRRGLRGPWCLRADERAVAYGHDDLVTIDPALSPELRGLLAAVGVLTA